MSGKHAKGHGDIVDILPEVFGFGDINNVVPDQDLLCPETVSELECDQLKAWTEPQIYLEEAAKHYAGLEAHGQVLDRFPVPLGELTVHPVNPFLLLRRDGLLFLRLLEFCLVDFIHVKRLGPEILGVLAVFYDGTSPTVHLLDCVPEYDDMAHHLQKDSSNSRLACTNHDDEPYNRHFLGLEQVRCVEEITISQAQRSTGLEVMFDIFLQA